VSALARAAQLAAFTAAGGAAGREKTDTEWLKELSGDLKKIAGSDDTLIVALTKWWDNQVVGETGALGTAVRFFNGIRAQVTKFLNWRGWLS
jgi:hypothetical protein